MEASSDKRLDYPSDLKLLALFSLFVASIALIIGVPSFLFNLNLPPIENLEPDTFEYFELGIRYLVRLIGGVFTVGGSYALISSLLTLKKNRIGWLMLCLLYLVGILGSSYLILLYLDLLTRYPSLGLPSMPFLGLIIGILSFSTLIRKKNRSFIFS